MNKKLIIFNVILFIIILLIIFISGLFLISKTKSLQAAPLVTPQNEVNTDSTPPEIANIRVSNISATSSIITWETGELADSLVNFGINKNYGIIRDPRADKNTHMIILEELLPDTTYFYRITSSDEYGNQGISSDYTFVTEKIEEEEKEGFAKEVIQAGDGGLSEVVLEEGSGGLTKEGIEQLIETIQKITSEEILEEIEEEVKEKAEEIVKPPTIILDLARIEVGTNYAIIPWETDKESNSIVALARESDYDEYADDPYTWKVGEPSELIKEHVVEVYGLNPATIYHFQISSESSLGLTGKSPDNTFKTKSILPEIFNIQITKVEEESATIRWVTNVPCSSIVEYTNLNNNDSKLEGNSSFLTVHNMQLNDLVFDTYYSALIKVESEDGEKAESDPLTFITIRDKFAPVISKVNTESTLYPGTENKVQTIVSWQTDEPAQCQLFYHQGLVLIDEPETLNKEEDYGVKHVQVITNFLPSTVYKFWIVCNDEAENVAKSEDFTMLTPTQEESIIDIIIKNFESTFGWLKKLRI